VRTFRWILVPALTLLVAGAAYACDKDHAGAQASAGSCTKSASAGSCMGNAAMANGGCSAHSMKTAMADAHSDCPFCNLATEIRAQKGKVTFSTVENKDGVVLVFAAVSKEDVVTAQAIMEVITHASISVENTKKGAKAMVKPAKAEEMAKLEAFIQNLQKEVNTVS
jgi:hypothetical protein